MASLRAFAALAGVVALTVAAPVPEPELAERQDTSAPFLHSAAVAHGKAWFGSELDTFSGEQYDQAFMTVWNDSRIFGSTTPGNTMKWEFVEPQQNTFNFSQGMQTVALSKATGKDAHLRCHNLVWHEELPSWVVYQPYDSWTNITLAAAMINHITKTVRGFGSNCYSWDVVNEAIDDNAQWRNTIFYQYMGKYYIPIAFAAAQAAVKSIGADIKLVYNDYNIEFPGAKQQKAVELVQLIKQYGIKIDGVGFESHFVFGETPGASAQMQAMQSFTSLGLNMYQTELDVRFPSLPPTPATLAQQASDYYNTIQACMKTPACQGMTVWDFDDAYSWVPSTFAGQGDACLYWANLTRKPAYEAVYQAITDVNCTVC
ncbi:glycoside hydrolase family 10 protein [Baudoinia panamericana UAMH 10762]|uniref:Beta-xylanase n=1 Tax=Baudoinia panamericana (strain UAMH 10762) TaxID=717646 RepID=M2MYR0_BAUPA|nr:glycoside hydrolase family 10 protein [Baudoinia panamericana UAMH 10762]EMC91445.1 glycoside hydrolase family 10 protein [Baudoinia panamericana UAMH 10762]